MVCCEAGKNGQRRKLRRMIVAPRLRPLRLPAIVCAMNANGKTAAHKRVELGKYIVADSDICHGKPTFKGSRVMVWQVLRAVERGEEWDKICRSWRGSVTREAIAEAVHLAGALFTQSTDVPRLARAAQAVLA